MNASRSVRGRLLVAAPGMLDPNFVRTVLLVLEHTSEGVLAVVLNRPSATPVGPVLERWGDVVSEPGVFFSGGPVATEGLIALARGPADDAETWVPLFAGIGSVDLGLTPTDVPPLDDLRVFAGHAGWAPGQLEAELADGGWLVVDASPADAFTVEPDRLWRAVLARQSGRLAWYANAPVDPRNN